MTNNSIPSPQPAPVPALAPLTGRTHELKTDAHVFSEVTAGRKLFEIRKNDRDFRCGDLLRLRSTRCTGAEMAAGQPLIYTGEEITVRVIGILRGPVYGLAEGWVIMSIAAPAATQQAPTDAQKAQRALQILDAIPCGACACRGCEIDRAEAARLLREALSAPVGDGVALGQIVEALEHSRPTHAHYPETVNRHAQALATARALTTQQAGEEAERHRRIGAAVERVCRELPDGCDITLYLERGYGGATMSNTEGRVVALDGDDERDLAREIEAGIDAARAAQAGDGNHA